MNKKILIAMSLATIISCGNSAFASVATLASYPFSSNLNANFVASGIQSNSFSTTHLSNAYVGNDGFGQVLEAYPTNGSVSESTAFANSSYFEVMLTAVPGKLLELSSLTFLVGKGGNSDPRGFSVRSNLNNFSSNLVSTTLASGQNGAPAFHSIDLSTFNDISSVDFQVFVWTPNYTQNSVDFSNLSINGRVVNGPLSVPEPGSLALLGIALAGLEFGRRAVKVRHK